MKSKSTGQIQNSYQSLSNIQEITLLTALGTGRNAVDLILELVDFLSCNRLFEYKKEAQQIRRLFCGKKLKRLVLICTGKAMEGIDECKRRIYEEYPEVDIEDIPLGCKDIGCDKDDKEMKKTVYEAVKSYAGPGLVISSGGRKTITQRIIEAGLLYGCAGYLSITAPEDRDKNKDGKKDYKSIRSRTLEFNILWISGRQFVEERQKDLIKDKIGDSFRSVYLFPGTALDWLMDQQVGAAPENRDHDLAWLKRLPKADLHCHLGGCQDERLLKRLASQLIEDCKLSKSRCREIRIGIERLLCCGLEGLEPRHLRRFLKNETDHCLTGLKRIWDELGMARHEGTAVLLDALTEEQIALLSRDGRVDPKTGNILWPVKESSWGGNPLKWYMACGDLGGSALLQSEGTLRLAIKDLVDRAVSENICYMEIRCSPDNYTQAGLDAKRALEVLLDEVNKHPAVRQGDIVVNFLVMATRHKALSAMDRHVALALLYSSQERDGARVVGFDLAGNEKVEALGRFEAAFLPLHRACMNITIHAGEITTEEDIWEAIYRLHARRIGHGLKLIRNKRMMDFARDHDLAIEMCPSSNMQTNSFIDYWRKNGRKASGYPLLRYLKHGIIVTINTDNRFISDTDLTSEYLAAARMSKGGLSRWQILKLIKNGFKAAFLPKDEKDRLLKKVDQKVFHILLDDVFPEAVTTGGAQDG